MILFFGPPGSGKSVQGKLLVERNGWQWLSTGELFRQTTDTEILDTMARGELVSDDQTNRVVQRALTDMQDASRIVLDGYPRNLSQAKWLLDALPSHGQEIAAVIMFRTPEDELVRRQLGRGRVDDSEAVIRRRLEIYEGQTWPVVDYYEAQGVPVITVNGLGTVEEVHERLQASVEAKGLTSA